MIEHRRWDPLTGGASAVIRTTTELLDSILGLFYTPFEEYKDYQASHRVWPLTSTSSQAVERPTSSSTGNRSIRTTQEEVEDRKIMVSPANSSSVSGNHGSRLAGRMAGVSMKSLANFVPTALQGMTVDIPLAMTEGMRNVPRLYGEKPQHQGSITGIKSGFALGGTGSHLGCWRQCAIWS